MTRPVQIGIEEYRDKVFACWLGKNIGGTLGAPYECKKDVTHLTFYDPLPSKSAPNDDLDLQLAWLKCLEDRGVHITCGDLADYWVEFLSAYPWNEYGFCRRNLGRGLRPPISGCFENYYIDEMGSPIRSEIWACIAPGDPQLAAALAWHDAVLDHAGGEGVYGEMFWAALEAAAFVVSDPKTLIAIGLNMIPIWSRISRVVRDAVWCHDNAVPWAEARERVLRSFGHHNPCHAPQNHGFTVLGWLYGADFGDKLCKAVNCGYDTDCTGATLGSVLGILGGTAGIPKKWRDPIGEQIVLHKFTGNCGAPKDIAELTRRTEAVAKAMLPARSDAAEFTRTTQAPADASVLFRNEQALNALARDPMSAIERVEGFDIALHYNGEPVLRPGIAKRISVAVTQPLPGEDVPIELESVGLELPQGWTMEIPSPLSHGNDFMLRADEPADRNILRVTARWGGREVSADFTILGPGEAQGYPCNVNVPRCEKCGARKEACVCKA
ncbi:MAG TPA: ADP-ribosylglycohydrolase family protein [Planctomycetota bacterium]|mgnify:CR=1 FL=1|nr:ADP-ribosylglycohydrolase family protein [Planctomycetota bacterium]HRR79481.1 ADP-ribosylglycohydrolase family protein [Planctomycetota bacterium]HRT93325.1 ADP-ribosylglycohydrolase family protein [Planctomycetota bacterium]